MRIVKQPTHPVNVFAFMEKSLLPLFILLFVVFPAPRLMAQSARFDPSGQDGFPEQMKAVFEASSEKKRSKEFIEALEYFWHAPGTADRLKGQMVEISNRLYEKKARPFPDYYLYLSTVQAFVNHNQYNQSYENWHHAITDLLNQPRYPLRHLNTLLETTLGLLSENKIFGNRGVNWYSRSPHYHFEYRDTLKLIIDDTQLVCHSKGDSIMVYDAGGTLYPENGIWKGHKGKITWQRSGFEPNKVYARLKDYTINMNNPYFEAGEATFYNLQYFTEPLKGSVEHKVMTIRNPETSTYPKFESSEQVFNINNIHAGINYSGGFSQHGAKFLGSGTRQNPATISIFRHDSLFITARSLSFSLRAEEILSNNTEIKVHLDTGFIYHPGLVFKYMLQPNEISLIRDGEGLSKSPFFDTYHNISIDSEMIQWNMSGDFMEMRMMRGAAENHAFFESLSYYRESFYNALQGMDAIHPLQGLKNYASQRKTHSFTALDYSRFLNLPESHVRQQVLQLSFFGFVGYNTNTDSIEIRERLNDYLLFRLGEKDYDVIRFKSLTPGKEANAVLNLQNNQLAINGVDAVSICDHQNVTFFPGDRKVTLKHNRNFSFDGHIKAGMLNLTGKGFLFSYDQFRINMASIDTMRMEVMTGETDYFGQPVLQTIKNSIANLSGYLQIDTANNKSGKEDYPHYPVLVSNSKSFVYYSNSAIQQGAYNKESFYFEADPFIMDSINRLNESNIAFEGRLISNILPTLENQLVVRDDFSLGFVKQSPPEGYAIYNNKARFFNDLDLSNRGLMGNGTLEYLTSKSNSKSFTFLPKEVSGQASEFTIAPREEGVEYPGVEGEYVHVSYKPDDETLVARSQEMPFAVYEQESTLDGELSLTPSVLKAKGTLIMPQASLLSDKMELSHHALMADSSSFNIIGGEQVEGISFKTTNLISQLDFRERQGRFTSRGMGNKVEFTENRYVSFINEFSWDMEQNHIYLGARGSRGNRFVSTHRKQDSLEFYAPLARYDMGTQTIEASEVKDIRVADASILLKDGIVKIMPDAVMAPLDSAVIELNDSLHIFKNARVSIMGKNIYSAFGEYDFVNGNRETQTIDFHNIEVSKAGITTAQGHISDKQPFTFNSHFAYKGEVTLTAGDTLLNFNGGVQMLHSCQNRGPQAFTRFSGPIDPSHVMIPIDGETQNFEHENLYHDIFLSLDSVHVYSTFLEGRKAYNDVPILSSKGFLTYNAAANSFDLAEARKMAAPATSGPILRYHDKECFVSGEGALNLGMDLDQVKLETSGIIKHLRDNNRITISAMLGAGFYLDTKSTQMMTHALRSSKAPEMKEDTSRLIKRLSEWSTPQVARKIVNVLSPTTDVIDLLPSGKRHTLCFTNINIDWNSASKSYMADGMAQLGWIKESAIARQVKVKSVITRSRGGNTFELYLEADPDTWFFFSYENGVMQTRSALSEYNTHVQALETDERKTKSGSGDKSYVFILSPESRMNRFMQKFGAGGAEATGEEPEPAVSAL